MSVSTKFSAGAPFPDFSWSQVGGGAVAPLKVEGWRLLVVYRGKHCPMCREYIGKLNGLRGRFAELGVSVWALSADPLERATEEAGAEGWSLPILAGLTEDEMRTLGLYISSPRSPSETDRNFSEPAMFLIRPDGAVHSLDLSNSPFCRPELETLIKGIGFVLKMDPPPRGVVD